LTNFLLSPGSRSFFKTNSLSSTNSSSWNHSELMSKKYLMEVTIYFWVMGSMSAEPNCSLKLELFWRKIILGGCTSNWTDWV